MPDSESVTVTASLEQVDPVFAEVVGLLYGDAVDPREAYDVAKAMDASEVHVNGGLKTKKRQKRQAQVGLASNALGITAGAAALGAAARDERLEHGGKVARSIFTAGKKIPKPISSKGGKAGAALAVGALGLQGANLAGDAVANRVLAREAKKDVKKALDEIVKARRLGVITTEQAVERADEIVKRFGKHAQTREQLIRRAEVAEGAVASGKRASKLVLAGTAATAGSAGYAYAKHRAKKVVPLPATAGPAPKGKHTVASGTVEKADYGFRGTISKFDEDKRLAFGWASLSEVDGQPVKDLQGDYAPIDEIEKSAYAYVISSRVGGDMHAREGDRPRHTSDLVESFICTPEKLMGMGIPEPIAKRQPIGWWVGFKVNDDEQWAMVKDGRRAGFSIHGKGSRVQKALEGAAS